MLGTWRVWLSGIALAACSVFPDSPEARDDAGSGGSVGGTSGSGGNGGASGTSNGGTGGSSEGGTTGGGGASSGGGTGGTGDTCYDLCFLLWGPGCSQASQAVIDSCADECHYVSDYEECAEEKSALLDCLESSDIECDDDGYPQFTSCDPQFGEIYLCIEQVETSGHVACNGENCNAQNAEFCCVHEETSQPHCHVEGDCGGDHIWCDGPEDCGTGQVCCATTASGSLTYASCSDSACSGDMVQMCNGSGQCDTGTCTTDAEFSFFHVCK